MKKLYFIGGFILCVVFGLWIYSSRKVAAIEYFINGQLIAKFPAENRNVLRVGSSALLYLRLSKIEGLRLLAATLEASPKSGDLMEVKFSGRTIAQSKNEKLLDDFSSVLSSAFPPSRVSVWFSTVDDGEAAIKKYKWVVEKEFYVVPKDLYIDTPDELRRTAELFSQPYVDEYLFNERVVAFLKFMGYTEKDFPLSEETLASFRRILTHYSRDEASVGFTMPLTGHWLE